MSIRIHEVANGKFHWAISDTLCPTCESMKNYPCIGDNRQYMAKHSVHIARVRANGYNAK